MDVLSREVYFCGENGQGKSNLLEALYFSSYGSSFRTHMDSELVKDGESSMGVRTMYREDNGDTHTTSITLVNGSKKIEKDGKILRDRKELVNTMPCVLYGHGDLDFAVGSPERRRFFIDQSLSMYDVMYIDTMRRYKRILKNRNICLKEKKYELLETYDTQMALNGIEIQKKRKNAVFQFNQIFGDLYEKITGIDGVSIKYGPSWSKTGDNNLPSMDDVLYTMKEKRDMEKVMCRTLTGPHVDRISFVRKGSPFVPTASTGQRRLLALLLRTSQATFYTKITGKKPVLLMDDVLLELDPDKREKVSALLPEYDQLFCTFLPGEPYERYMSEHTRVFRIKEGGWEESR